MIGASTSIFLRLQRSARAPVGISNTSTANAQQPSSTDIWKTSEAADVEEHSVNRVGEHEIF